jgi:hypothetical protein
MISECVLERERERERERENKKAVKQPPLRVIANHTYCNVPET